MSYARGSQPSEDCQNRVGRPATDLTSLVRAHHAAVYRYSCRLCGSPTDAEDLTQQAFLIAQQKLHQLRQPERACAWLLAIVRSCFLKSVRKWKILDAQAVELRAGGIAHSTADGDSLGR